MHFSIFFYLCLIIQVSSFSSDCMNTQPMFPNPKSNSVRVVSYNILSDKLCNSEHYIHSNPIHLENNYRYKQITNKFKSEIKLNSIICLQEVSQSWKRRLIPFFNERGYQICEGQYGTHFNGYMGVFMAWPKHKYSSIKKQSHRISHSVDWINKDSNALQAPLSTVFDNNNDNLFWSLIKSFKTMIVSSLFNFRNNETEPTPQPTVNRGRLFQWDTWDEVMDFFCIFLNIFLTFYFPR